MIINGQRLLQAAPIKSMERQKRREHGVSYGLTEAGYDIRIRQTIRMTPLNRFQLASAIELFDMPRRLVGVVADKSSWARRGLSVFNTIIEPGWRGFLTLELVYHGSDSLFIPEGAGIAQVLFHELIEPAAYAGKYQDQADRPVGAIHD